MRTITEQYYSRIAAIASNADFHFILVPIFARLAPRSNTRSTHIHTRRNTPGRLEETTTLTMTMTMMAAAAAHRTRDGFFPSAIHHRRHRSNAAHDTHSQRTDLTVHGHEPPHSTSSPLQRPPTRGLCDLTIHPNPLGANCRARRRP